MGASSMNYSMMPKKGIKYALYKDRVVYEAYDKLPEESEFQDNLIEMHLFDNEKEYRYVKLSGNKVIERLISDDNELGQGISDETKAEHTYIERIYTTAGSDVEIVNYISYDENDIMMINNYRLQEVKVDDIYE